MLVVKCLTWNMIVIKRYLLCRQSFKAAEQQTSLLEEKLKTKKNRKIKTQGYGIAQNMHDQYFAAYMTLNYFTMHACGCAAFPDREYQESLKNGTTQGLVQSVHNRPVPCDHDQYLLIIHKNPGEYV